ncbi:MAG: ABC-F family ATP-binding cassette domain-containing protein [Clostridiales bacterium]|jgi:ATP-binding cassette subfamily F protein 3|nr:ABC-F family ATP-binding cassette domain-containing protein [Clostridiales bacterium]
MLLQMRDVQKAIGVEEILADVSFIIEEKEKVALVGVNGAGKTSVFRLITGQWTADEGGITKSGSLRIGYLPQLNDDAVSYFDAENSENLSLYEVLDRVFLPLKKMEAEIRSLETAMGGFSGEKLDETLRRYDTMSVRFKDEGGFETESRLKGVLRGLGFSESQWRQPFGQLSGGQRTRALLGKLLLERSELLLLDEPTNHLDIESVAWLEDYLRNFPGAILVISHDRYFLDKVATKTIEIENKKSVVYNGNYSYFVNKKATDRALAEKAFAEQQKVLKHHEEVIKTIRSFKTEAAIIRAKSREKMLVKIERVDAPAQDPAKMRLRLKPRLNSGHDVLFAEGLKMGFDGKKLFSNISFEIKKGDKIALIGPNGIGKTTLLKILVSEIAPLDGRVREGVNVRVGYYDQSFAFSAESEKKTIFQEIADTYPRFTQTEIRTTLAAFMFIGDDVFKPISALSGGERGRVQLTKIMLAGANFLVLDEPTNHLDLFSKEILEEALREFSGTLIFISHDRYFINNTATKIFELHEAGISEFAGNYDYYLEKKESVILAEAVDIPKSSDDYLRKKEIESQARRKKTRIEKLEAEISKTEFLIAECDEKFDEIAGNAEATLAVFSEKTELEDKLVVLYEEWEALNEGG